ncbi:MAG: NHL repeat-containing protein, partial [Chloroflexota bacterium]
FLAAQAMRPHLDGLPEFDLVVLFTTLVLPTATAFLIKTAGWNPRDYSMNICTPQGVENMSAFSAALVRLLNGECWRAYFTSGVVRSGIFLVFTLVVSVLVGLWWDRRRWLMAAAIYHSIFFVFFTSVFTNLPGWSSGMVGALGYWLEQQGVERGNQPGFYYFFIVPFYEFLPMLFAFLGVAFWARLKRIHKVAGYWLGLALLTLLAYSLVNWVANNPVRAAGGEMTDLPGLVGGGLVAAAGIVYWLMRLRHQWMAEYGLKRSWKGLLDSRDLFGFVPSLLWWLTLTYLIYSLAGEKMPWLTVHFVTPMALLAGWYFNEKLSGEAGRALFRQPVLRQLAITLLLLVAAFLALAPLLTGQISLGDQQLSNLTGLGRFLGSLVLIGVLVYFWRLNGRQVEAAGRRLVWPLALFILLSLLTIRFTYLSSFPNADYTTEFMVYAHGAPATKSAVMAQVDRLSMRLNGDKSMKVAFDDDSSWPMTWYLRDYPNRLFFGKNPGRNITDAPVIIAGSLNWSKVEPFLGDDYDTHTYTFLWWPMEEYRKISWNALLGDPNQPKESRRGLLNPNVRRAMWDIFFYRDYQKFGEVFGGTYTAGQWPLRHDLRLYIRKDVLANLWDYGVGAVNAEAPVDPYEANEFTPEAALTIGAAGAGQGQLQGPRNLAIGPDGNLYVADSGNHRIQVFDPSGGFVRAWGSQGDAAGQFNEPWGIAVDENYVYVADTWNHRLQKFTLRGDFVQTIGQGGSPAEGQEGGGLFFGPRSILLLPDDQLLVTDTGNHRLQILSRDGQFVRQVGLRGSEPGQFNEPVGLAVAPDGSIYLADTWNGRIQKFSAELQPLLQWQVDAWEGESTNNKPYLAVDNDGRVYVTDPEGYRVLIFSGDGEYLGRFGRYGQEQDALGLPTGIAVDGRDNVYVTDAANNRILQFAPIFGGS